MNDRLTRLDSTKEMLNIPLRLPATNMLVKKCAVGYTTRLFIFILEYYIFNIIYSYSNIQACKKNKYIETYLLNAYVIKKLDL